MTPREIIAEAWAITRREKALRRWGFTSTFLETLLSLKLLLYQTYFAYEFFYVGEKAGFFDIEFRLYDQIPHALFWTFIGLFVLLVLIELVVPSFCTGVLIGLAAKSYRKEPVRGGMVLGLYNFAPMLVIHEMFLLGSLTNVVTCISVVVRYIDDPLRIPTIWMIFVFYLTSNFLQFFANFAPEAVVIRKMSVFDAVGKSFKLIVSYLSHVMFLILLLFVISLRILMNAAMVLVVPGVTIGVGLLLATFLPLAVSYSIAGVVAMALIVLASYFFSYIHVFKQTVWTIAYLELSDRKDLDVIIT